MTYYLYRHIRLDKNQPFYIGIGTMESRYKSVKMLYKRAFSKKKRNNIWNSIVSKTAYIVEILFETNSKEEIEIKEMEFISIYGRIINNTGILANIESGGRYNKGKIVSETTKLKISKANKGKKRSKEQKQQHSLKMKGRSPSEETRLKLSLAGKNRRLSSSHKLKLLASSKGRLVTSETRSKIRNTLLGYKQSEETKVKRANKLRKKLNELCQIKKFKFIITY